MAVTPGRSAARLRVPARAPAILAVDRWHGGEPAGETRVTNRPAQGAGADNVVHIDDHRPVADGQYYEAAVRDYRERLRRFVANHLNGPEDVADVVQEAYLRLVRYKHPEEIENVQAFLFTTASNLMRDRFRRAKTRMAGQHVPIDEVELLSDSAGPDREWGSKEIRRLMRDALSELDEHCRYAFLLHRFEQVPYAEIAKRMGTTVGVVRRYVSVALAHCALRLRDYL